MIERNENRYRVTAPMLIANARALLEAGRVLLGEDSGKNVLLDLDPVQEVDSSALTVIFAMLRSANAHGVALRVANPPASLLSLAGLYGVSDTLPLA